MKQSIKMVARSGSYKQYVLGKRKGALRKVSHRVWWWATWEHTGLIRHKGIERTEREAKKKCMESLEELGNADGVPRAVPT